MAVSTVLQPTHRLPARVVLTAVIIAALIAGSFLAGRWLHPATTTHSSRVSPISAQLNGTVNSGPDNPVHHTARLLAGFSNTPCTVARHTHIC